MLPNPNSYRRIQAGALAPSGKNWGYDHRDVALRIPRSAAHSRRIEHRVAGADANPYVVLAGCFSGYPLGASSQKGDPGPPVAREADLSEDQTSLPTRLDDAIQFFSDSEVLRDYLGPKFTRVYSAIRRGESNDYHSQIPRFGLPLVPASFIEKSTIDGFGATENECIGLTEHLGDAGALLG